MLVDFELIRRAQKGDPAAFNEIVTVYRKRILGHYQPPDLPDGRCRGRRAGSFCAAVLFSRPARTAEVFEPWLYRLTQNAAYDYLRKQKRRQEFRMSDLSEQQVMMADAVAGGKAEQDGAVPEEDSGIGGLAFGGGIGSRPDFVDA